MSALKAPVLEVAVQDPEGAALALAAGAHRVELCQALGATGGLTPSAATVQRVVATGIPCHVLVRCRTGGFEYSDAEVELMAQDIAGFIALGAAGVVIGAMDGAQLHKPHLRTLMAAAGSAEVTLHRAFDVCEDQFKALEDAIELGFTRILTSGGAPSAPAGTAQLAQLVTIAAGRIELMAGGGVSPTTVVEVARTGVDAVHGSFSAVVPGGGSSGPGGGVDGYMATQQKTVEEAVAQLAHYAELGSTEI